MRKFLMGSTLTEYTMTAAITAVTLIGASSMMVGGQGSFVDSLANLTTGTLFGKYSGQPGQVVVSSLGKNAKSDERIFTQARSVSPSPNDGQTPSTDLFRFSWLLGTDSSEGSSGSQGFSHSFPTVSGSWEDFLGGSIRQFSEQVEKTFQQGGMNPMSMADLDGGPSLEGSAGAGDSTPNQNNDSSGGSGSNGGGGSSSNTGSGGSGNSSDSGGSGGNNNNNNNQSGNTGSGNGGTGSGGGNSGNNGGNSGSGGNGGSGNGGNTGGVGSSGGGNSGPGIKPNETAGGSAIKGKKKNNNDDELEPPSGSGGPGGGPSGGNNSGGPGAMTQQQAL